MQILHGIFCFGVILFSLSAAQAEQPDWQTVEGGRIRISIIPAITEEGKGKPIHGVIELELEPDWKTYWSNSGNSGIVPDIVLDQTAKTGILFLAPQLLQDNGEWAFGYKKHVLLPFRIYRTATGNDVPVPARLSPDGHLQNRMYAGTDPVSMQPG